MIVRPVLRGIIVEVGQLAIWLALVVGILAMTLALIPGCGLLPQKNGELEAMALRFEARVVDVEKQLGRAPTVDEKRALVQEVFTPEERALLVNAATRSPFDSVDWGKTLNLVLGQLLKDPQLYGLLLIARLLNRVVAEKGTDGVGNLLALLRNGRKAPVPASSPEAVKV